MAQRVLTRNKNNPMLSVCHVETTKKNLSEGSYKLVFIYVILTTLKKK
jgi:hypothetical protein